MGRGCPRLGQDRKSASGVDFSLIVPGPRYMTRTQISLFLSPSSLPSFLPPPSILLPLLLLLVSPLHCPGSPHLPRPYPHPLIPCSCPLSLDTPVPFPCPGISPCVHLPCRMLQLSLSWLGLGPATASLWLFLPLAGASCLLAYLLSQAYAVYEISHRLRCFPQPPKRNWLLGHLGLVSVAGRWDFRVEGIARSLEWGRGWAE